VDKSLVPVLAVALLTWGGVFFYFLRLESLTRGLEKEVAAARDESNHAEETQTPREVLNI
jgi:hypothetical protein